MVTNRERNPTTEMALVDLETPPNAASDWKAVRTSIGAELRTLHAELLREGVPDRMAELLRQLDQLKDSDGA
jgi:Anti-sigma factor NepR